MTESTNVGRNEVAPDSDGGMSVTVQIPGFTILLANESTVGPQEWRPDPQVSTRDARVIEALLTQAINEIRGMSRGAGFWQTPPGLQTPEERG